MSKKSLCTIELPHRSCSPGWSHRLIYLVHPLRLKLEYRNKGADHPTWAKHAGFNNTGGWIKISPSILSWLSFSDRKMIFYLIKLLKNFSLLQNGTISSFSTIISFSIALSYLLHIFKVYLTFFQNYGRFSNSYFLSWMKTKFH